MTATQQLPRTGLSLPTDLHDTRAAVIHLNFGPYHVARLEALGRAFRANGVELIGIEMSRADEAYPMWADIPREHSNFRWITLSTTETFDRLTASAQRRLITEALDRLRPSIVFVPGWGRPFARSAGAWSRHHRVASIVFSDSVPEYTAGRSRLRRWAAESYKRWYLQGFDAAVVSGEQARAYLVGLGVPRDRVFLGLDVVDNDMIGRAADEARCAGDETSGSMHRRFVVPARMIPRKNHLRLIDAYARYRRGCEGEPWDMLLIGGGPTETIIDERIASCGVPGLRHIPFISDPRVLGHHYGSASAMVLPSWLETWGLVLNEGAAAGLPLLASRQIPATQHLIREGENGWTFDALDVGDIADALAKVASQPRATLERMGRISREMVSDWGLDRHVREIASALRMSLVHPRHSVTRRGTTARLSGPSRRARSRPRPPRVIAKGWR